MLLLAVVPWRKLITHTVLIFIVTLSGGIALFALIPGRTYNYVIVSEESALGVMRHSPVYLGSVSKGYIGRIENHPSNPNHSIITICLNQKVDPQRTIARLGSKGIIGPVGILQLRVTDNTVPVENPLPPAVVDKFIAQLPWEPSLLESVFECLNNLTTQSKFGSYLQSMFEKGQGFADGLNPETIRRIVSNLDSILAQAEKHTASAVRFLEKAAKLLVL